MDTKLFEKTNNHSMSMKPEVNGLIQARRSCRGFKAEQLLEEYIRLILEAGTKAPSGKNGQPWRFIVIHKDKELLKKLSALTAYNSFVSQADCLIVVYLDKTQSYDYIKDVQAIGACIENMLLQAAALGIGSCWIGEILNKAKEANTLLEINTERYEFMAVVAFGYPNDRTMQPRKKTLEDCFISYL